MPWVLNAQNLSFYPEKPSPGDSIIIEYNPAKTVLKGSEKINATIYFLEDGYPEENSFQIPVPKPRFLNIPLKKEGKIFRGVIHSTSKTKLLKVLFSNNQKRMDAFNRKGYSIMTYRPDKEEVVQGAMGQKGLSKITHAFYMGLSHSGEQAFEAFKEEFRLYPESQNNFVYFLTFTSLALQLGDLEALDEARAHLKELSEKENPREMELNLAYSLAELLKKEETADLILKKIEKSFPSSFVMEYKIQQQFYESSSLKEKEKIFNRLQKDFNQTESQKFALKDAALVMANAYLPNDADKFFHYAKISKNRSNLASQANVMAWELVGGGVDFPAKNLKQAKEWAIIAKEVIELEIENPSFNASKYPQEKEKLNSNLAAILDTYALVEYKLGNKKEALEYQELALQNEPRPKLEIIDRYTLYFDLQFNEEETKRILASMIKNNRATQRMKDRYKELAGQQELELLLRKSNEHLYESLRNKMINKAAPEFSLMNLDGEKVNLADLKGKVVILDFWATWCSPCLAAFPGMQQVVDQYEDDLEVEFLFINAWESESETVSSLSEFLATEEYSFHVLLDQKNEVAKKFGVDGIPAKFVLDKNGQIRFKDEGFKGIKHLVEDLSAKIEILKGE